MGSLLISVFSLACLYFLSPHLHLCILVRALRPFSNRLGSYFLSLSDLDPVLADAPSVFQSVARSHGYRLTVVLDASACWT